MDIGKINSHRSEGATSNASGVVVNHMGETNVQQRTLRAFVAKTRAISAKCVGAELRTSKRSEVTKHLLRGQMTSSLALSRSRARKSALYLSASTVMMSCSGSTQEQMCR